MCHRKVYRTKEELLLLRKKNELPRLVMTSVLFCENCNIPYINNDLQKIIKQRNDGYEVNILTKDARQDNSTNRNVVDISCSNFVKKFYTQRTASVYCEWCTKQMELGITSLLDRNGKKHYISGALCPACHRLYINNPDAVYNLLLDNPNAKGYYLNGKDYSSFTTDRLREKEKRQREKLITIVNEYYSDKLTNSGISLIVFLKKVNAANEFNSLLPVCFSVDEQDSDEDNNVYLYTSTQGRKVLTAFFHDKDNSGVVEYKGKRYSIFASKARDDMHPLLPEQIYLDEDGGYHSKRPSSKHIIVGLLLYSPYTKQYEILKATYNKATGRCYTAPGLYSMFVNKYGNPFPPIESSNGCTKKVLFCSGSGKFRSYSDACFSGCRDESVLKSYGYSVAKNAGMSNLQRQRLLAEMVDLGIVSNSYIMAMLDWFINMHNGAAYDDARTKWSMDMQFIREYKANPNRFLILEQRT